MNWPGNQFLFAKSRSNSDEDLHARLARLLCQPPSATFALQPFAPLLHEDRWWLAALVPPWSTFGDDCEVSGDVVLTDLSTRAMRFLGDDNALLIGPEADPLKVFTDGITLNRDWADQRGKWVPDYWTRHRNALADHAKRYPGQPHKALHPTEEHPFGLMPGMALCGRPEALTDLSALRQAKVILVDSPAMIKPIEDRLLAAVRLPTVRAAPARTVRLDGTSAYPVRTKRAFGSVDKSGSKSADREPDAPSCRRRAATRSTS